MSTSQFRLGLPLIAALALSALAPSHAVAQALPVFTVQEYQEVVEGNAGTKNVLVHWTLSAPAAGPARFTWYSEDGTYGPHAGVDFVGIPATVVTIPVGQTSGDLVVQVIGDTTVEAQEIITLQFRNFSGAVSNRGDTTISDARIRILDDDTHPVPPLAGNDDHIVFEENTPLVQIHVEENDLEHFDRLKNATLTLTSQPQHGTVEQVPHQYPGGVDQLLYRPEADFSGRDEFGYRLCSAQGECVQAKVILHAQPTITSEAYFAGRTASQRLELDNLRALTDARYLTSTLASAREIALVTTIDSTPHRAWDSRAGMAWVATTIPATPNGQTADYRVHVLSKEAQATRVDLMMGIDLDGDGAPSANEQRCFSGYAVALNIATGSCDLAITVGAQPVTYWIAVHSREPSALAPKLQAFQSRMDANDGKLTVTGPVTSGRLEPISLTVSWYDPSAVEDDLRVGYVRIVDGTKVVGDFRVAIHGGRHAYLMLPVDGTPLVVDVPASIYLDRYIFFDVPAGATNLTVTGTSDQPVEFAVTYWGGVDAYSSSIPEGPLPGNANDWMATTPGVARTKSVANPFWQRWFVVVRNTTGTQRARLELKATVQAAAPTIRSGSYYNPKQPGSGVILYPAGSQWAGLWYTYTRDGRPTWYYLQAPRPGLNGIWRSAVLRTAWDGDSARNTKIGELAITATGPDKFIMSYLVDGSAGSQQMSALGRGCPSSGGVPVDISSHWFDPLRAGTGYSVQMWPNYEFFAAFMYDRQGLPTYLLAERAGFGGAQADLPLSVLKGPCPTCGWGGAPERRPAGNLRRTIAGGTLTSIELDVDYEEWPPLEGRRTWTVTDRVQALGGPGTTQGCAL